MPESTARTRVLVVDDEPPARRRLRRLLESDVRVEVVGEAGDGVEAVEAITGREPDLVFLDVQMPGMDGFEVIEAVGPAQMPAVIFVTAFSQHAVRAFDVNALDYLLKPFVVDRFRTALDRAIARLTGDRGPDPLGRKLEMVLRDVGRTSPFPARLLVRAGERLLPVKTTDIRHIEAAEKYVILRCSTASYTVREGMRAMEAKLDPREFVRVHRSHIVRIGAIREVEPLFHGEAMVVLTNGDRVPLSRTYRDAFEAAFTRA